MWEGDGVRLVGKRVGREGTNRRIGPLVVLVDVDVCFDDDDDDDFDEACICSRSLMTARYSIIRFFTSCRP